METLRTADVEQQALEVTSPAAKSIKCVFSSTDVSNSIRSPSLVFTHGSGGSLKSDAIANFARGFAQMSPILCFQGNMNLKSRVNMFEAVCKEAASFKCLGGRSMGARAATMSIRPETTDLVLVSYPLHTGQQTRDDVLLKLPVSVKVLFIIGEKDQMCSIDRLQELRSKMPCKTWLVIVGASADHSMNAKPKLATKDIGMLTGRVAAAWLNAPDPASQEGSITWDEDTEEAQWSGWSAQTKTSASETNQTQADPGNKILSAENPKAIRQVRKRKSGSTEKATESTLRSQHAESEAMNPSGTE